MDLGLAGKVFMVGGASRGLGYAVARALAAEGARVSMASRDFAAIDAAGDRIRTETGADVLSVPADLRSAAAIDGWVQATVGTFRDVDGLFVNTGGPPAGGFFDFDDQAWQDAFELLVLGGVRLVRAAVPFMRTRGGGSIVFSTSSSVREPIPNLTLSNVVRAAVPALAKTLAAELARDRIRVNNLMPGRIDTDRVRHLDRVNAERQGLAVADVQARYRAAIPLGRYGEPGEYARAAVFLLSDAAAYITGATLLVDGGQMRSVM